MTLPEKILAGFVLLTGLCSALLAFAVHHYRDPLACLDDRASAPRVRAHLEADRAPDLFAHALEEIRNLPTASGH